MAADALLLSAVNQNEGARQPRMEIKSNQPTIYLCLSWKLISLNAKLIPPIHKYKFNQQKMYTYI